MDLQQELARFSVTETQVQGTFNQALQKAKSGSLSDADFARIIDADIIAPWHLARLRLDGIHELHGNEARLLSRIKQYADTRERGWSALSGALRQQDRKELLQANALQAEAEQQLKDLNK
jgi:hypothetical protein